MIIIDNSYYYSLARGLNSILREEGVTGKSIEKAKDKGNKLLKSLNDIDLTSDRSAEGIYYAISSFLSITILMSRVPIVPNVISKLTIDHLNTKVLPKYRLRLYNIYKSKIRDIEDKVSDLKVKMDDENKADILQEIEALESVKNELERDCEKILMVK
jgi:hypothetical protein